jgi:hypothetical protein
MEVAREPESSLAASVLPNPLYRALTHVFTENVSGCMLVGGTALAGYYAGHRRSDDLDLFTEDSFAQKAMILAVKSLPGIGAVLADERTSAHFYQATCHLDGHDFTVQVVLDTNLFVVGSAQRAGDGVVVADLMTLLEMKAATLVSRCSEKDLYDLAWLFEQEDELDLADLVALGEKMDGGMNAEAVLTSLVGTELCQSACDFSRSESSREVFAAITRLQAGLVRGLESTLRGQPPPRIAELIRRLE